MSGCSAVLIGQHAHQQAEYMSHLTHTFSCSCRTSSADTPPNLKSPKEVLRSDGAGEYWLAAAMDSWALCRRGYIQHGSAHIGQQASSRSRTLMVYIACSSFSLSSGTCLSSISHLTVNMLRLFETLSLNFSMSSTIAVVLV